MLGLALVDRSSRVVAVLLLLATVWGLPHRQVDDEACLPIAAGEHDASQHAFAPLAAMAGEGHCAICHWMRGLKPTFVSIARVATPLEAADAPAPSALVPHRAPCGAQLPARAPPAA